MNAKILIDMDSLLKRFLRYVQIDSASDGASSATPSSEGQWTLARTVMDDLLALGAEDVRLTDKCCVIAKLPSNLPASAPSVAFLAHLDSSDACPGKASPIVVKAYDGREIRFPKNSQLSLSIASSPELAECLGHDIVTASGDSLLGGDDKAGIAIVMSGLQCLMENPSIKHGPIVVCFNPDEEIGRGSEAIPIPELAARCAYTFDSDGANSYNYETFSADRAVLSIVGVPAHPGSAKGKMVNAIKLLARAIAALPKAACPERTSARQGFIHPCSLSGSASEASAEFLLRDFSEDGLAGRRDKLEAIASLIQEAEPRARVKLEIFKQYRNMRESLERDMRPVDVLKKAMRKAGLKPRAEAVRGGTDGSRLTEMGLPTPNIFAGFRNPHSLLEWVSVQDMEAAARTMVCLASIWADERVD